MSNIEQRVAQCFLNVFEDVKEKDLSRASQASIPQWDSVAQVTLLSAVAEEFGLELDDESFEALTSYALIVDFVEGRVGTA
jgi:acyl carrier protein